MDAVELFTSGSSTAMGRDDRITVRINDPRAGIVEAMLVASEWSKLIANPQKRGWWWGCRLKQNSLTRQ